MQPSSSLYFCLHSSWPTTCSPGVEGSSGAPTFPLHAHDQALLVAAVLAAVALTLVDEAVFVIPAGVDEVFPYGSFEEAFAAFAAVHTVVFAWFQENIP